ncbi:MAG TPA: hypothetical protein VIN08_26505 [Ohtaekwangia sp.]|uniref:hypothetical protein n=1 Tax=Ohtaekwangia sp. TaxID=2066019 RepID=UPI002F926AF4
MKIRLAIVYILLAVACTKKDKHDLLATWKVDSVYNYHNGFDMVTYGSDPEILYHFQPDGRLRMTLDKEFRYVFYEWHQDTLVYRDNNNNVVERLTVLKVDQHQLVVQRAKLPIFHEKNQDRYEIRYLSRVKED